MHLSQAVPALRKFRLAFRLDQHSPCLQAARRRVPLLGLVCMFETRCRTVLEHSTAHRNLPVMGVLRVVRVDEPPSYY